MTMSLWLACLALICGLSLYLTVNSVDLPPLVAQNLSSDQESYFHDLQSHYRDYLSTKTKEECPYFNIINSIDAFLNENEWKQVTNGMRPNDEPVFAHTPCISHDSFGNSLSEYMEARICSYMNSMHYINVSPVAKKRHAFFDEFPDIVVHPSAGRKNDIRRTIKEKCPCPSICHEWDYGLMHKNMGIPRLIFRKALESFIQKNPSQVDSLQLKTSTYQLIVNGNYVNDSIKDLPFIPDASIHYRCGDNLVTHYGFLPFFVFKKYIPNDAKTIYVMAEVPDRHSKQHSTARCSAIFSALGEYLKTHFPTSTIVIMRGNDMVHDMIRLTYSKTLICSASTFCFWPAIASNTTAYFPITKLIAKENTKLDYGPNFVWMKDDSERQILGKIAVYMQHSHLIQMLTKNDPNLIPTGFPVRQ